MSMFNEEEFKEGLVSELSLFDLPATQTSVSDVYYEEIRPLTQASSDGPFEFRISGQNSMDYIDLKNSQIYVKVKVVKASDGSALTSEKVGPANLFLQSLFSSSEVTLQNKASFTCNYNPYRAYIQTLLNYGQDALNSQIQTQGWLIDDSDSPGVTDPSGRNNGLFIRADWIKNSKTLDLQGPLFHDLFSMDRYLLNQVDVKIKLERSANNFALLAADSTTEFKIDVQDIYFLAKKIRVNSAVIYGHSKILEKQNALYPYTKVECRSQSIATGSTSFNWENLFQGKKPEKLVIGFVKSKALNGDYTTNPFNFENCGIKHIAVYADGLPVGGNPLKMDFTKGTTVMRAYTNLLVSAGKWRQDEGNAIDKSHFISGSTLFAFQLEPNFDHHGEFMSLVKNGNVRLDVQFQSGLTAYGDHGIVYTARAAKADEEYQNIISVPSTPMEIDNTTKEYPGLNFGFVFRSPMTCDTDYHRNELYVYDYFLRGLLLLENYNSSAMKEEMNITRQHYGISKENAHIAVDWISHNVYWTDPLLHWIAMQPGGPISDPTLYKVIIKDNLKLPLGIAVDPLAGYLFWSDFSWTSVIERSTLTGNKRTVLIYSQLNQPNAIVADPSERRIYWTDLDNIHSVTYDGTDRKQVVRADEVTFWDVALFQNVLITTDVYTFGITGENSYSRFYDKTTGEEITEKRLSVDKEMLLGVCMYHGDTQPVRPEQDRCKTAGCQDICVNEPTKATCLCREGFVLNTTDGQCRGKEGQHQRAVIINTGKSLCLLDIRVLNDHYDYAPSCFYTGNDSITFFDVNMYTRQVYFATGSTIFSVYVDQVPNVEVVTDLSYNITGLTYDYGRERLYFAVASDPQQIWYIDVGTNSPAFLVQVDKGDFRSLTVVPSQNKAYWLADLNLLQSVDLAGITSPEITNLTLVYHPYAGISYPKHMVHDNKREIFYVLVEGIDGHSDLVGIDYTGYITSYFPSDMDIVDFALYKEYIVLINKKDGKSIIRSADLGAYIPGYALPIVDEGTITGVEDIHGVKILDVRLQPTIPNLCGPSSSNGGCEHICLTDGNSVTCKCKLGFTLHTDGKQCVSVPVYDDFILVTDTTYNEIFQISLNNPDSAVGIRTPAVDRPDGVIYNYQTSEVIWTSTTKFKIWAVNLKGTRQRLVADVYGKGTMYGYPDQIALDPSTENIYYTGNSYYRDVLYNSFIAVLNNRGESTVVVWEGHRPRDIELDPAEGLMFWSDYSDTFPVIYRAGMDGSSKQPIHTEELVWPNGIALDPVVKRIYWTDGYLDHICYSDYDGSNRQTFTTVASGLRLMDLELVGDYLYYVANNAQQVTRVNKNNKNDTIPFGPQTGLGKLYGLDVYSSSAPSNTPVNPECATDNGGCSHFCLPIPGGYSCGCPLNDELLHDGRTCSSVPRCEMSVLNGKIHSSCVGTEGNTCHYTCDDGYKPRPSVPFITCQKPMVQWLQNELQWDVQDPCQVITCPNYIKNGVVMANCRLLPNDMCMYRCYEGFVPDITINHILCQKNGTWNYITAGVNLCKVKPTTTPEVSTEVQTEPSPSKSIGIGVGIGVGVLVLIVIVIIVVVCLIRSGIFSPFGKKGGTPKSAFENPRYADNSVDLGETNTSSGYTTLEENKIVARATNPTYDNIVPKV